MAGCVTGAQASAQTRDSAGIAIVTNADPARAAVLQRVSARPGTSIGEAEAEPAYEFGRIVGARRLGDGRIVVADAAALEIRVFGADGKHRHTIGRRGGGPGEFQDLQSLSITAGDSIVVYDARLRRISILAPSGEFVRAITVRPPESEERRIPIVLGRMGAVYVGTNVYAYSSDDRTTGVRRDTVALVSVSPQGVPRHLRNFPGNETFVVAKPGGVFAGDLPYGHSTHVVTGRDRILVGTTDSYRIDVLDGSGRTVRSIRAQAAMLRTARADLNAARDAALNRFTRNTNPMLAAMRADVERSYNEAPTGRARPFFGRIIAGQDGRIWVSEYVPQHETRATRWTVFGADGRMLGNVVLPAGVTLDDAGRDWVLGHFRDDLDVVRIGLWPLQ
jgi:hypothetical protein